MQFARLVSAYDSHNPKVDRLVEMVDLDVLQLDYQWPHQCPINTAYAPGLLRQLRTLHKSLYLNPSLHVITDAGGGNPWGCTESVGQFLCEQGDQEFPLTMIRGDNVLPRLEELVADGIELCDITTGTTLQEITQPLLAAQVELGAGPLSTALSEGSRMIVAGCYDMAAPAIATAVSTSRRSWDQLDELAKLAVAANLPQTLIDLNAEGVGSYDLTIRPCFSEQSHSQNMLTEIFLAASSGGSIRHADVECQIKDVQLLQQHPDTYAIGGVTGRTTKGEWLLRLTYQVGYFAEGILTCQDKEASSRVVAQLRKLQVEATNHQREVTIDNLSLEDADTLSLLLVRCRSSEREPCVEFVSELSSLPMLSQFRDCHLSPGTTPNWQPEIANLRCLIPRDAVAVSVDTRPAKEWR